MNMKRQAVVVRNAYGASWRLVALIALLLLGPPLAGGQPAEEAKDAAKAVKQDAKAKAAGGKHEGKADSQNTHPITVSGRALNQNGKPIAGAEIFLAAQHPFYGLLAETKTDADGN